MWNFINAFWLTGKQVSTVSQANSHKPLQQSKNIKGYNSNTKSS